MPGNWEISKMIFLMHKIVTGFQQKVLFSKLFRAFYDCLEMPRGSKHHFDFLDFLRKKLRGV